MGLFDFLKKKPTNEAKPEPKAERKPEPMPEPEIELKPEPEPEPPKPTYKTLDFKVAGISYREKDVIKNLMFENDDFNLSKTEIIENGMTDERIFKYEADIINVELIPEPTNEHDPNAVKVVVDNILIGYVPANKAKRVKKIVEDDRIISLACAIYGGPYQIVREEYDDEKDKEVYTMEKDSTYIGASISINYN